MLNVFILEDSIIQLRTIENNVQRVSNELQIKTNIKTFTTIADLQKAVAASPTGAQNVYILDLEINGINNAGLEISQKIRQRDKLAALIFTPYFINLNYKFSENEMIAQLYKTSFVVIVLAMRLVFVLCFFFEVS